jgi:hypothetical protein
MSRHCEELLILTKTYPSPSKKYRETTCVAALTKSGEMRRLFPLPYRLLVDETKFKKWEWIQASVATSTSDQRPESRRIDVDSIHLLGRRVGTESGWFDRQRLIAPQLVEDFHDLEERRKRSGYSLGIIRPKAIAALEIAPAKSPSWTPEEYQKLIQDGLFDTDEMKNRIVLEKVPYDFHYRYISGEQVYRHKIIDWEAGALYWKCIRAYGRDGWEEKFRQKYEVEFEKKDLLFLMGTMHRFPDQWLIVGVIYPPKPQQAPSNQQLGLGLDL